MRRRILMLTMLAVVVAAPAAAQSTAPPMTERYVAAPVVEAQSVPPGRPQAVVESRITTGRPYSAEATTEFVQVLGDGNRIARKGTVRIYRDGEGRTRREDVGPDGTVKSISISDPVANVSYVLDPVNRTAMKSTIRMVFPLQSMADKVGAERGASAAVAGKIIVFPADAPGQAASEDLRKMQTELIAREAGGRAGGRGVLSPAFRSSADAKRESLGQQLIDGVPAEGTRTTTVIPAGAIGNVEPITVVSEQWFSPDLEILLMTKHSDPRSGETTYSLSNIVRAEPRAGIFDVPPDYTIKDTSYLRTQSIK